jgi:hypothetical protein
VTVPAPDPDPVARPALPDGGEDTMSKPTDMIERALRSYLTDHNLPAHTMFVVYSPRCTLPRSRLTEVANSAGSVAVALEGVPDDELWFTDATLDHASVTKIST